MSLNVSVVPSHLKFEHEQKQDAAQQASYEANTKELHIKRLPSLSSRWTRFQFNSYSSPNQYANYTKTVLATAAVGAGLGFHIGGVVTGGIGAWPAAGVGAGVGAAVGMAACAAFHVSTQFKMDYIKTKSPEGLWLIEKISELNNGGENAHFMCNISSKIPLEPVRALDCPHVFEREQIEKWLQEQLKKWNEKQRRGEDPTPFIPAHPSTKERMSMDDCRVPLDAYAHLIRICKEFRVEDHEAELKEKGLHRNVVALALRILCCDYERNLKLYTEKTLEEVKENYLHQGYLARASDELFKCSLAINPTLLAPGETPENYLKRLNASGRLLPDPK